MKKVLKSSILVVIMVALLLSLVACGGNKLVATKEEEDSAFGKYTEEMVVEFKNDKVSTVEMSMIFDKEETAEGMYSLYNLGLSMANEEDKPAGMEVKQDGKKLTIKMDANAYAKEQSVSDEELTKEAVKKSLEEAGYTVK